MVTRGTILPHELSGVARGLLGSENVCQRQREPEHPTPHGQFNSHLICELNGEWGGGGPTHTTSQQ